MPIFGKKKLVQRAVPKPVGWIPPSNVRAPGHTSGLPTQKTGSRLFQLFGVKGGLSGLDLKTEILPTVDVYPFISDRSEFEQWVYPVTVTTISSQADHTQFVPQSETWEVEMAAATSDGLAGDQNLGIQLCIVLPDQTSTIILTEQASFVSGVGAAGAKTGTGKWFYPRILIPGGWGIGFIRQRFLPGAGGSVVVNFSGSFRRVKTS